MPGSRRWGSGNDLVADVDGLSFRERARVALAVLLPPAGQLHHCPECGATLRRESRRCWRCRWRIDLLAVILLAVALAGCGGPARCRDGDVRCSTTDPTVVEQCHSDGEWHMVMQCGTGQLCESVTTPGWSSSVICCDDALRAQGWCP